MAIRHSKVSSRQPSPNPKDIQPAEWNADHTIEDSSILPNSLVNTGVVPGTYVPLSITINSSGFITGVS